MACGLLRVLRMLRVLGLLGWLRSIDLAIGGVLLMLLLLLHLLLSKSILHLLLLLDVDEELVEFHVFGVCLGHAALLHLLESLRALSVVDSRWESICRDKFHSRGNRHQLG